MDIISTVYETMRGERDVFCIGKSVCGNDILCAHRGGYGGKQLIITAAIHARECYTALAVLRQLREFDGQGGGAYFVPLVNPDGAAFFESGATFGKRFLIEHADMRRHWKANADGVDLNCNFDAQFGCGKEQSAASPAAHGYIGAYPLCAPESRALAVLTLNVKPAATVSYHCMGGELYWQFYQDEARRQRDCRLAEAIAGHIGVKKVDGELDSAGGYKDWCVQALRIPAFTIELIARGRHPFFPKDYAADIDANADLPKFILDLLNGEK